MVRREWLLRSVENIFTKYSIKKRKRHLFICLVICENRGSHENSCSQTSVFTSERKNNARDKVDDYQIQGSLQNIIVNIIVGSAVCERDGGYNLLPGSTSPYDYRPVTRGVHGVRSHPPTSPKGPHFDTQYPS